MGGLLITYKMTNGRLSDVSTALSYKHLNKVYDCSPAELSTALDGTELLGTVSSDGIPRRYLTPLPSGITSGEGGEIRPKLTVFAASISDSDYSDTTLAQASYCK